MDAYAHSSRTYRSRFNRTANDAYVHLSQLHCVRGASAIGYDCKQCYAGCHSASERLINNANCVNVSNNNLCLYITTRSFYGFTTHARAKAKKNQRGRYHATRVFYDSRFTLYAFIVVIVLTPCISANGDFSRAEDIPRITHYAAT